MWRVNNFLCPVLEESVKVMSSEKRSSVAATMMGKQGWDGVKGLGPNGEGIATHVRVSKKDNVLGIGYEGQVKETWSQQSAGFAAVLKRVSTVETKRERSESEASDDDRAPANSRLSNMYAKRRTLKTGALSSGAGKEEILGGAGSKTVLNYDSSESDDEDGKQKGCTLKSPTLQRLLVRYTLHEPVLTVGNDDIPKFTVSKPRVKPPKCTDTPFVAQE